MNNLINDIMYSNQEIPEDIEPAGAIAASPKTVSFFEDYADRYKRFNNKNRRDKILSRIKNNRTRIADKNYLINHDMAGFYRPATHTINVPLDTSETTYTHELTHALNDSVFGSLPRSRKEKQLLKNAYKIHAKPLYKLIGGGKKELFTTNTELRRAISNHHNNVLGNELDNVIKNMSDNELTEYMSGYLDSNDYWKPIASSAEELYNKVPGANISSTGGTRSWRDLSRKERRDWRRAFRKNAFASTAPNSEIDRDKLNAVREALLYVAKQGGKINPQR